MYQHLLCGVREGVVVRFQFLNVAKIIESASHASAIAILKYSSLDVKEESRTKSMSEVVSQIAILGPTN